MATTRRGFTLGAAGARAIDRLAIPSSGAPLRVPLDNRVRTVGAARTQIDAGDLMVGRRAAA